MSVTRNYPLHRALEDFPYPSGNEPAYEVPTKYGTVMVVALRATRVSVAGGIPHNVEGSEATALTIRGVEYSVQAHFNLWSDGRWHAGSEASRDSQWHEPHLSRRHDFKNVSVAAQRTAREELESVVNAWATNAREALESAERRYRAIGAHHLAQQLDEETDRRQRLIDELEKCQTGEPFNMYPNSEHR